MIRLTKSINAWGTRDFEDVLKKEIEQLDAAQLPLQQGMSSGSYALDNKLKVMILSVTDDSGYISLKAGVFYTGVIAGCNCADDPTPVEEESEYCEVQLEINKVSAETTIKLVKEQ
jgi:hypothetical protein